VLAVQYERLSNPPVILAAAPLSLLGVVVNNAILLVEYIEIGRHSRGLAPFDAIIESGTIRAVPDPYAHLY
jgi:multidrug efflux pump subunit AcrB